MAISFTVSKAERTKLRRMPFLPRLGFTVEVAGRQFTIKNAPMVETFLNWRDIGFTVANFKKIAFEEWNEINFPSKKAQTIAAIKNLRPKAVGVKGTGMKKSGTKSF
jgi:hypothetical protein